MDKVELRLKCLEIASEKAADPREILARAEMFEKFVQDAEPKSEHKINEVKKLDPSKKLENSKILP